MLPSQAQRLHLVKADDHLQNGFSASKQLGTGIAIELHRPNKK